MTGHAEAGLSPGGTDDWPRPIDLPTLIEETRQALATLSADDLEELAVRAQLMLDGIDGPTRARTPRDEEIRRAAAGHRAIGDLLCATASNMAVLRRLRDRRSQEMNPPWAR